MNDIFAVKPKIYQSGHWISQNVCKLLSQGFDGQLIPSSVDTPLPGLAITYGILRNTGNLLKKCEELGQPYLYCDHSFFNKYRVNFQSGLPVGHYRLIKNGRYIHDVPDPKPDRWEKLDLPIAPWRKSGSHIVVVPMSGFVAEFIGISASGWLRETVEILSRHTDRDIIVKPKDDPNVSVKDVLVNAWAVVAAESMVAVSAVRNGIPVFTFKSSACADVANFDLKDIENPKMPPREEWLWKLAYMQFSVEEIVTGLAKRVLYG